MNADPIKTKELFLQALKCSSVQERDALLNEACGKDEALRQHVDILIEAHEHAGAFLEKGVLAGGPTLHQPALERTGTHIGPYKLLTKLGEGGMGVVFLAEQKEPVERQVALKIIRPGMDTERVIARFEAERQALAVMDHPNVAKVLDAGTTDNGRPYFVMEVVQGIAITKYCDQHELPVRERLELFIPVCQAVQHAHQKGIVHRDIKPSNILVAEFDGRPVPKVIDFGVAKAIDQSPLEQITFTQDGQIVGTPEYMSPEQAQCNSLIDTRSDVYSLGVVLYELLTGDTPFDRHRLRSAAWDEMMRVIREEEPPKPSTKISSSDSLPSVAAHRHIEPARFAVLVRGELDWIVMKALEKQCARRYESATGLAEDIEHYLHDQPVLAGPASTRYLLRKFARRNKSILATAAVVALALVVGTGVATWQAVRAHAQAARADEEKARAQATLRIAVRAVDEMYTEIADKPLAAATMAEPVRLQFLERAIRFYTDFTAIHASDRDLRYDRANAYAHLGSCHWWLGESSEGESAQRTAIQEFEQLIAEAPHVPDYQLGLANCCVELGNMLRFSPEGELLFERALSVLQPLRETIGDDRDYRFCLARAYGDFGWYRVCAGPLTGAETPIRAAIALYERLVSDMPNDVQKQYYLAQSYCSLAFLLAATGRTADVKTYYEKSIRLHEQILTLPPVDPLHRWQLCWTLNEYGRFLQQSGQTEATEDQFRKSLRISAELTEDFPRVPEFRNVWHTAYTRLTQMLSTESRSVDAERLFRDVIDSAERLAARRPTITGFQYELSDAHIDFGYLLLGVGRIADAERQFQQAISLLEKLGNDTSDDPVNLAIVAGAMSRLGLWHWISGKPTEGHKYFAEALQILRRTVLDDCVIKGPKNYELVKSMNAIAWFLATCPDTQMRNPQEAIALATKVVESSPNNGMCQNTLGVAHYRAGNYTAAVEILQKSVAMNADNACDFFFLSMAHWQLGNSDESKTWYDRAVDWLEKNDPYSPELQLFRAEADQLLGIEKAKSEPPNVSEPPASADSAASPDEPVDNVPKIPPQAP